MNEPFLPMQSIADVLPEENQIFSHFSQPDFASLPIKRSKIWELKEANRCPIVGTCLSMDELVRFAQRYHFKAALNDAFLLHVEMTDCVATRSHASEAIQKHLDLKYQIFLTRFDSAKTDTEVFNLGKNASCMERLPVPCGLHLPTSESAMRPEARFMRMSICIRIKWERVSPLICVN